MISDAYAPRYHIFDNGHLLRDGHGPLTLAPENAAALFQEMVRQGHPVIEIRLATLVPDEAVTT